MRSVALPFSLVLILTVSCAHAAAPPEPPPRSQPAPAAAAEDGLWQKIDPRLRSQLADKTARTLRAVARLSAALTPAVRSELEARGLRFLSLQPDYAHVEGDAEALLRLAARDEVSRLAASGPLSKSREPLPRKAP